MDPTGRFHGRHAPNRDSATGLNRETAVVDVRVAAVKPLTGPFSSLRIGRVHSRPPRGNTVRQAGPAGGGRSRPVLTPARGCAVRVTPRFMTADVWKQFADFLSTPRGQWYLLADTLMLLTALVTWYRDGAPGTTVLTSWVNVYRQ